jgi:hypothetical protein
MSRYSAFICAFSAVACLALVTAVDASVLVDFKPDPGSPTLYEIGWTGGQLVQRPGSVGNGDGTLDPWKQTPGGLNIQTPFHIVGVPGSTTNTSDNSTTFYDVTLQLTGLAASGPPVKMPLPGVVWVFQNVDTGTFTFLSTDPGGGATTLLTGTINSASIVGKEGQASGWFESNDVDYTGGKIYDALIAAGGNPDGASLSWSLIDIGGGLRVVGAGSLATLQSFDANMTGLLTPEPATLCLMGVGVAVALVSRRKR